MKIRESGLSNRPEGALKYVPEISARLRGRRARRNIALSGVVKLLFALSSVSQKQAWLLGLQQSDDVTDRAAAQSACHAGAQQGRCPHACGCPGKHRDRRDALGSPSRFSVDTLRWTSWLRVRSTSDKPRTGDAQKRSCESARSVYSAHLRIDDALHCSPVLLGYCEFSGLSRVEIADLDRPRGGRQARSLGG